MYDMRPFEAALIALIQGYKIDSFCGTDAEKLADKFIYRIIDLAYMNEAEKTEKAEKAEKAEKEKREVQSA